MRIARGIANQGAAGRDTWMGSRLSTILPAIEVTATATRNQYHLF